MRCILPIALRRESTMPSDEKRIPPSVAEALVGGLGALEEKVREAERAQDRAVAVVAAAKHELAKAKTFVTNVLAHSPEQALKDAEKGAPAGDYS